ncbi:MAG: MgtC/SapB family protein [Nanoarchaeota archaeon]
MDLLTIALRFFLTFALTTPFGILRQKAHKPIGFGTYIYVSVGSCALAITALSYSPDNPLPLLAAIVTGIGFLGAGALIKTSDKIFGFTSAASIWLFAIFGLVIGSGEYPVAAFIYAIVWLVTLYDQQLERKGIGSYQRKLELTTKLMVSNKEIDEILGLANAKHKLVSVEVDKKAETERFAYVIEGKKEEINRIPKLLFKKDWFVSCRVE